MEDVWTERDTTPSRIEAALRAMLSTRHAEAEELVPARVLNLVVIVDREFRGEVANRLEKVGRYHPSRLILCSIDPRAATLDAVAHLAADGGDEPERGVIAVVRERVELAMGPQHLRSLDTIVDPLLVSDLATMVWSPHGHAEGVDALRRLAQIVLIDSLDDPDLGASLTRASELAADLYVVDLSWLRSTPWRERVAAAFDPPKLRSSLREIAAVTVRARPDSAAAAVLFFGWLASRLGWRPEPLSAGGRELDGRARAGQADVALRLEPTESQSAPGLAGVTIETASGDSMSLERGPGGLKTVRRARAGAEHEWTVLGASRGESGILGEGVRQALLRDPTYRPALAAAQAMVA